MIQKPATSSFVSGNGPSVTERPSFENRMRDPFELGWSPSPASSTPAFAISSLKSPIAPISSRLGMTPASESLLAFTRIMNRIDTLLSPPVVWDSDGSTHPVIVAESAPSPRNRAHPRPEAALPCGALVPAVESEEAEEARVVRGERRQPLADERAGPPRAAGVARRCELVAVAPRADPARRPLGEGIVREEAQRAGIAVKELPHEMQRPRVLLRRRHRCEPYLPVEPVLVRRADAGTP